MNIDENNVTSTKLNITVIATGKALANILNIKLPSTNCLLGSSAKKNEGAPIVNAVIKVN